MKISAKVIILGSSWDVKLRSKKEDEYLVNADGYCDKTMNLIVVSKGMYEFIDWDFTVGLLDSCYQRSIKDRKCDEYAESCENKMQD